jgi:hypothetical protein
VLGTSQVLLLLSFRRNDLKSDKPNGDQTALKILSCVVIACDKGCQEMMNVQSQLLFIWSSARH